MAEIMLIRHGQASFHSDDYDKLSETGWEQARLLGEHFANLDLAVDAVYTGTLRRHRETLAGLRECLSLPASATEIPGLDEFEFGGLITRYVEQHPDEAFDRHDPAAFYRCLRKAVLAWYRDELPNPYMSWPDYETRLRTALSALLEHPGERALVVTSGGPISALIRELLDLDIQHMVNLNLQTANTGVTRLVGKGEKRFLGVFNSLAHLEHPDRIHLQTWS